MAGSRPTELACSRGGARTGRGERRPPRNQGVEDQAERADLVLHAVAIVLVELSGPAVEDLPGQGVAALLQVGLRLDLPAVARFVGQAQDVQDLGDPPVVAMASPSGVGRPSRDSIRITSQARTAPAWMEPTIRRMSSQWRSIRTRSIRPRAAYWKAP